MNTVEKTLTIEDATITLKTPYKVAYSFGEKTLAVDIGIHSMPDKNPNVLVYFPLEPKWNPPFENQAIPAQTTDIIADRIDIALQRMGFNVRFCLPMGYNA